MFGTADLIVISAVDNALANLRAHPSQLEFILSPFMTPQIEKYFGTEYIKNCVDYINNNRLLIKPYLFPDLNQVPSLVIGSTTSETGQYLGDFGTSFIKKQCPQVYMTFDADSYSGTSLYVDPSFKIEDKVWIGMTLTVGAFSAKIKSVLIRVSQPTLVELDSKVPPGTSFKEWKAQMYSNDRVFTCGASMERASVQCKLTTSGDIATHRVMCLVIRYALKHQRLYMDQMGLQNTVVSQGMPVVTDDESPIYETMFGIEGDLHDFWVEKEDVVPSHFGLKVEAISENPGDKDVDLFTKKHD